MLTFFRSIAAIFRPPFEGLGLVVLCYFAWAHMIYPHNDIIRGNLPDPDDYMYLTQALDWVQGQDWFDNVQHRLDPPQGVAIPFSRIVQIPIAFGILLFHRLGLPLRGAATLTALIEPLILLGFGLSVLRRVSGLLVPARWSGASSYVALFVVSLLFEFMPGHVDHHGLVIILMMAAIGCVLRLMDKPQSIKTAAAVGFILALSLMIALECLPWVLLLSAWLGLWSLKQGGVAARRGAAFAGSFLLSSAICLELTRPPTALFDLDILTYSAVYVLLAAAIAVPFAGVALAASLPLAGRVREGGVKQGRYPNNQHCARSHSPLPNPPRKGEGIWGRVVIGLTLAALSAFCFLHRFPELVTGPYGAIDPRLVPLLLDVVTEARPILAPEDGWTHMLNYMSMGFIALPAAAVFTWRAQQAERAKWALVTLLLAAAIGLTLFYQYRFLGMESALAVLPLTALLQRGWGWVGRSVAGRGKVFAEIGLLLLVGPLPSVIIPALFDSRSFNTGMLLFPVDSGRTRCDMADLEHILRDPKGLGREQHIIVSYMDLGPELLFRTDHKVLSAPFHMNVQGNLDATRFFVTPDPAEARAIAQRRGIDLVVACRAVPSVYLGAEGAPPSLAETLFRRHVPEWLAFVPTPTLGNFLIFRVHASPLSSDANASQAKKYPAK